MRKQLYVFIVTIGLFAYFGSAFSPLKQNLKNIAVPTKEL